jgi:hypothetical protein
MLEHKDEALVAYVRSDVSKVGLLLVDRHRAPLVSLPSVASEEVS